MRRCLAPLFVGRVEADLDRSNAAFDTMLATSMVKAEMSTVEAIAAVNPAVADFVGDTRDRTEPPVIVSGDCLTVIGCLGGLGAEISTARLIWFDAHGDFHTYETTQSGHMGGMPLAMIAGRGEQSLLE